MKGFSRPNEQVYAVKMFAAYNFLPLESKKINLILQEAEIEKKIFMVQTFSFTFNRIKVRGLKE